jgi:nucleoside-diphosphate-sugar epimerase
VVCDSSKIQKTVGWKAEIALETSLKDTLDYWRNIV